MPKLLVVLIAVPWLLAGCTANPPAGRADRSGDTVVWINFDGLRWDYPDRVETPAFDRLSREGAVTRSLAPAFPSLTFPAHVSLATGVPVHEHGIAANAYYDRRTGEVLRFPPDAALLQAEPIWLSAERQDVRAAVFDWPVSHRQQGPVTASRFNMGYEARMPDEPRLFQPLEAWAEDHGAPPLRLLMGYATATDSPGHAHGPDAPEMDAVIREADALLGRFVDRLTQLADERLRDGAQVYLVLTTDHGMSTVTHAVNAELLLGLSRVEGVEVVTSGNIANLYFTGASAEGHAATVRHVLDAAGAHDFASAWTRADLPARFGYANPHTVGDMVVVLGRGYIFSSRAEESVVPIQAVGGPLGMHGYDVESNPDMYGFSLVWRYPDPLPASDLGRVDYRRFHPTVARLLGIDPASGATGEPLDLGLGAPE